MPGICNQLDQVPARTGTVIGILRVPSEFRLMTLALPEQKVENIVKKCPSVLNSQSLAICQISKLVGMLTASVQAMLPPPPPPPPLQEITDGTNRIHNQVSDICYNCDPPSIMQGEVSVVDSQFAEQQQQTNHYTSPRFDNNVRCIKDRLGANLQHCLDTEQWNSEESGLHINTLIGINGGEFCSENILQKQKTFMYT